MKRITLIFLCFTNFINGQTTFSDWDINKISSYNNLYFLRTIPFEGTNFHPKGKTVVYKADSTVLYEIQQYCKIEYNKKELFLSNDGQTVAYIINGDLDFTNYQQKSIIIYKSGQLFKEYALHDLINCDSKRHSDCTMFYSHDMIDEATEFETDLTRRAIYQLNNTLLIFCKMGQIIKLNLNTGTFVIDKLSTFNTKVISQYKTLHVQSYKVINPPSLYEFPPMANGKKTEEELADFMGMRIFRGGNADKYKIHNIDIDIVIDIEGNAHVVGINKYRCNEIPAEAKIYSFFSENKFETKNIPIGVDGWIFKNSVMLINRDLKIAEREKQEEIEKQQQRRKENIERKKQQERKRIDECSKILDLELNKEITSEEVGIIKNLKSIDEKSVCHFKFPNDTSFSLSYLNTYKDIYEDFPVSDQLDKQVNFELRLWVSGMSGKTGLFRLIYDNNGKWNAGKYVVEDRKVIYSTINLNGNWNKIWDRLLVNNILTFPDNPTFKHKRMAKDGEIPVMEVAITDGTSYRVELLSKENNRQYSISNPIGYYRFYTDSKPLKDFNRILEILSTVYDYRFE